jgi:Ca2+/Na+ antiporter
VGYGTAMRFGEKPHAIAWRFCSLCVDEPMTDRALLFLASLVIMIGALGVAIWLIVAGQTGTFDGNFLLLSALVVAAAFALYLKFLIKQAIEAPAAKPAHAIEQKKAA